MRILNKRVFARLGLLLILSFSACGDISDSPTPAFEAAAKPTTIVSATPSISITKTVTITATPSVSTTKAVTITATPSISSTKIVTPSIPSNIPTSMLTPSPTSSLAVVCSLPKGLSSLIPYAGYNSQIFIKLTIRNIYSTPCKLDGLLQVKLFNGSNQPLPIKQVVDPNPEISSFNLEGNGIAYVIITISGTCKNTTIVKDTKPAVELQISLPPNTNQPRGIFQIDAAQYDRLCGELVVSPFERVDRILTLVPTPTPVPPTPTSTPLPIIPANTKPCRISDLIIKLGGRNSGGTGRSDQEWLFINNGVVACTLQGYPKAEAIDQQGNKLEGIMYQGLHPQQEWYFPNKADQPILVRPHEAALLIVESYRCDANADNPIPYNLKISLPSNQGYFLTPWGVTCENHTYTFSYFTYANDSQDALDKLEIFLSPTVGN